MSRVRRGRRSRPQRLLIALNCLLVVAALLTAGGFAVLRQKIHGLHVVSAGRSLAPETASNEPRNFLIIGTDNADRLPSSDPVRGGRETGELLADVIMVMRVEPSSGDVRLVSIPRDTYLPIAPFGGRKRINAAIYGPKGPQNLIRTIKDNFGISIDNYVEIDFAGFRDLVEILDGVPVYFTSPVRDSHTGLYQPESGCVTLDPVQALAYARSRHLQYKKDGKWIDDPTADKGRISRQQDFIKRAAKRAIDRGARNPATALELFNAAARSITIDETLSLGTIRELVTSFRNFNVDSLDSTQVPTHPTPINGAAYESVVWPDANEVLEPFWGTSNPENSGPRDLIVTVAAAGSRDPDPASAALEKHGFDADTTDGAAVPVALSTRGGRTTVRFGPNGRNAAAYLARWVDASDLSYAYDPALVGHRVHLVLGDGFESIRSDPLAADVVPQPPAATTTTMKPLPGASTTSVVGSTELPSEVPDTSTTTTTTTPGIVPTDPDAALRCTAT